MPRALVIRTAGTNCDGEMVRAFTLAGAPARTIHLHQLVKDPARIGDFDLVGFPGGFSYGDDIASGRIFAMRARERLYPALREALQRGCPMIGACNGFQVLVQVGLLPGPAPGEPWPMDQPPAQSVALTDNIDGRFVDRWVPVKFEPSSRCVWTKGLNETFHADSHILPVAHGEGRFVAPDSVVADLESSGRIALRYTDNYNGSQGAIAGICDASGLVFALMPHPERFLEWNRHPYWTRLPATLTKGETIGVRMFRNAVEAASRIPA